VKITATVEQKIVVESPLSGDFKKNFRFLLWCMRAVWLEEHKHALASHLINPWFMDDTEPEERQAGMSNPWAWDPSVPHMFFTDLGISFGMAEANRRCGENIPVCFTTLQTYSLTCFSAFERGEWPPHTPGFELAP
jgi:hypothetical protein